MELFYVSTSSVRIFYTSITLNDRFKQYQVFSPLGYREDYRGYQVFSPVECRQSYRGYFMNRTPKWCRNEIYQTTNRFEKAPVIWDSNFCENSGIWTMFSESPWGSFDQPEPEPETYKPVTNIKRKRKKRKKMTKNAARKIVTKEQLDDELDQYMMSVK